MSDTQKKTVAEQDAELAEWARGLFNELAEACKRGEVDAYTFVSVGRDLMIAAMPRTNVPLEGLPSEGL